MKGRKAMQSPNQLFRDPDTEPTGDVLAQALAEANNAYVKFVSELENRNIELVWRYYTDGKSWLAKGLYQWTGVRGGKKEMTVFWLSIWDGFFKVSIFVPEKCREDISRLPLTEEVKQMIADAKQMGNQLRYFPLVFEIRSDEMFSVLFELMDFKKRIG